MQAVVFDQFGGPDVLHLAELPDPPPPGRGEVAVDITASTVNPTDRMMRSGQQAAGMVGLPPPWIAGMEFSGRVAAVEPGTSLSFGVPVIGVVNPRRSRGGAYARRIVVPAASVTAVAHDVELIGAATVPMNALTALLALEILGLERGSSLLVTGGAGMLGGSLIPLAHSRGLRVFANVSEADVALAQSYGADYVLPRNDGLASALRAICPEGVDGLVDCALMGAPAAELVRDGGSALSVRRNMPIVDPRLKTCVVGVLDAVERSDLMAEVGAAFASGLIKPRVAHEGVFPAARAADAHVRSEASGLRGRVVITFSNDPRLARRPQA